MLEAGETGLRISNTHPLVSQYGLDLVSSSGRLRPSEPRSQLFPWMGLGHTLLGSRLYSNGRHGRTVGMQRPKATSTMGPWNYTQQCDCCDFLDMEIVCYHRVLRLCRTNEVAVVPRQERSD